MAVEDFHPPQLPPFIAFKDPQTQKSGGIEAFANGGLQIRLTNPGGK